MKKELFNYFSIFLLIVFSFYYTDKITTTIIYKSTLMNDIINNKSNVEKNSINAVISNNYIIPGLNSLQVDELNSYYNMKKDNIFIKSKYIYKQKSPLKSINDNKKYIINQGNMIKNSISLLVNNNPKIINYSKKKNIKITLLINKNTFNKDEINEQINYEDNKEKLDILLNKYKINKRICIINDNNDYCINNNYFLVKPSYIYINDSTNNILSGDIILIDNNLSINKFKILLKKIYYNDLNIEYLSILISEER